MPRKFIPVEESFRAWEVDPAFLSAYEKLDDEFALANAMIEAGAKATGTRLRIRFEAEDAAKSVRKGG